MLLKTHAWRTIIIDNGSDSCAEVRITPSNAVESGLNRPGTVLVLLNRRITTNCDVYADILFIWRDREGHVDERDEIDTRATRRSSGRWKSTDWLGADHACDGVVLRAQEMYG